MDYSTLEDDTGIPQHELIDRLHEAFDTRSLPELGNQLIKYNYSKHFKTATGHLLLETVKDDSYLNFTQLLLKCQAKMNIVDSEGSAAIHVAAKNGCLKSLKLLVASGSPLFVSDDTGRTALHWAVMGNYYDMVSHLLNRSASINRSKVGSTGETVMHLAAKHASTDEIFKLLVSKGGDINVVDKAGNTPLYYAVKHSSYAVAKFLCAEGVLDSFNNENDTALTYAISKSKLEMAKIIMRHGIDYSIYEGKSRTPLSLACSLNLPGSTSREDLVNMLIQSGADINCREQYRATVLHTAVIRGDLDTVDFLLDRYADINAVVNIPIGENQGMTADTPLTLAIIHEHMDIAELLIERGADVKVTDTKGMTVLHKLLRSRAPPVWKQMVADTLIERGAKLNISTVDGLTPLDVCVIQFFRSASNLLPLTKLVSAGALLRPSSTFTGIHKTSSLCRLAWQGDLESAKFLVSCGWDLQAEMAWLLLPGKNQEMNELLEWLGDMARTPQSLKSFCRLHVREVLIKTSSDTDIEQYVCMLPVPTLMQKFIMCVPEVEHYLQNHKT